MAVVESADAGGRALARGATMIQLRAPNLSARQVEIEAMQLARTAGLPILVSSRCDIALAAGLAGVNLPENDISVADAKRLLGARTVSRSVHSVATARQAEAEGADFVIFGPVWPTSTHPGRRAEGLDGLKSVVDACTIPVIAIGGVTAERIPQVLSVCGGYAAVSLFR
jgi:thiamine-phosphate diphosphorylase